MRPPLIRWSTLLLHRIVMLGDWLILVLAAMLTAPSVPGSHLPASLLGVGIYGAVLGFATVQLLLHADSYRTQRYRRRWRPGLRAAGAVLVVAGVTGIVSDTLTEVSRADWLWLLRWIALGTLLLCVVREALRVVTERGLRSGLLMRKTAIIGATPMAEQVIGRLSDPNQPRPCRLIGIFDDRGPDRRPAMLGAVPTLGSVRDLGEYGRENPVDLIVIALPWDRARQIWDTLQEVQSISADVFILLDSGFKPQFMRLTSLAGAPALQVMQQPMQGARGLIKSVEDYVLGVIGLLIVGPLMVLIAIAVRLDSHGPVLFRQKRVGLNRKLFDCFKFRTLLDDPTDRGVVGVRPDDPRITRVGKFLRRTSLDELPQLLNVLRGEMSIVGPRPHVPQMLVGETTYAEAVREYTGRHRIKPGITGWAQVNGARGRVGDLRKAEAVIQFDMDYIENWSVWLDLRIIVRTVVSGFLDRSEV